MSTSPRADAVAAVEEEIRALLHRVRGVIGARARAVHEELPGASYVALTWLAHRDPVRASEIVDALDIDKGSLSRHLHHLEELGLVRRSPDPADGRASLVSATPEALRRLDTVEEQHRRAVCDGLADWTVADLGDLADRLARYNRALVSVPS